MKPTRFMQVMFSATEAGDEELTAQVGEDIESAKYEGQVDTDEVSYISLGEGKVMIIDRANGECTIAEQGTDDASSYDLIAMPTEDMDKFLHPEADGVTPNYGVHDFEKEDIHMHEGGVVSPEVPGDTYQSEFPNVMEVAEESREFSVTTDNTAVQRIFSDQAFCERIFAEVLESEDTAIVGNLKIEKTDEDEIVVTDTESGDQAKVELDGDEMEVTELDEKGYSDLVDDMGVSEEGQHDSLYVVGLDPVDHVLVDSPVEDPEEAQVLAEQLSEIGVEGIGIFENPEEARDHASELLGEVGVSEVEQMAEPEQAEFSDHTVYVTRYFSSDTTAIMDRLFSETPDNCDCQESIEDAIESGEEVEDDNKIITPIDSETAVIEDKETGEFTKATLEGDSIDVEKITEDEADELREDLEIADKSAAEIDEEKKFSEFTNFQYRLYSEDAAGSVASQEKIEDAIESGEQIETSTEIITPIDSDTAVVEDKESGEFTKVTLDGDEMETDEISEEEADELTGDVEVADETAEEEEKKYSYNFEYVTAYMQRLYSEEEDSEEIEDAIESGEKIEDDDKIITPIDSETAIIEDKENGEFTKATLNGDDLNVEAISEDEADELTEDLVEEETEEETAEREYSEWVQSDDLARYFAEAMAPAADPNAQVADPNAAMIDPNTGLPVEDPNAVVMGPDGGQDPIVSVENIEDKALVAVQSIQDAANQAVQSIQAAKEAPAPMAEEDLQEAQFSERSFCQYQEEDTLSSFLNWR